jgi:osmotically-inducible protein OsmY
MSSVSEKARVANGQRQVQVPFLRERDVVERRAAARLRRSPYPEVHRVACEFHEGVLTLRGRVPSYYLKQIAQTAVLEMEGIDEINNQVEVVAPQWSRRCR